MNILKNTTELALLMCAEYAKEDGTAVDATCGNGHDTLWLSGRFRKVYAFDIQESAIESTRKLLAENDVPYFGDCSGDCSEDCSGDCCNNKQRGVQLIRDSHGNMEKYVKEEPQVVIFNLGYLPGGDKNVTTEEGETLQAIEKSLKMLAVDGLLCITMYQGHEQGARERAAILEWAGNLNKSRYHCVHTNMVNQKSNPPEILWITKKKRINGAGL